MASWRVAQAKARFSAVLDMAETEGPQLVRRRKREFYIVTKEQLARQTKSAAVEKPFVSAWDALRPSADLCFDHEFPRAKSKARAAKF
jgi:hypothetical protein